MGSNRRERGFSAIEMITVLVVVGVAASVGMNAYGSYARKASARRAAEVFASDLALARGMAIRGRQNVSVAFDETAREYVVRTQGGREVVRRAFGPAGELRVDAMDLEMEGDSVTFNSRGFADLRGSAGAVGRATFTTGSSSYAASFNALGASKVAGL